jgi:hypothetical protein
MVKHATDASRPEVIPDQLLPTERRGVKWPHLSAKVKIFHEGDVSKELAITYSFSTTPLNSSVKSIIQTLYPNPVEYFERIHASAV